MDNSSTEEKGIVMILNNIITEVGFILLGGLVALIPVYLLGLVLKEND